MSRAISHIAERPIPGDIIELVESDGEALLRVIVVAEDHVGFKEYGAGRRWLHLPAWKARIDRASVRKIMRAGDQDLPF